MKTIIRVSQILLIALLMGGCSDKGTDDDNGDGPPGSKWTVRESGSDTYYRTVAGSDSAFVVVGHERAVCDSGIVCVSENGVSWERLSFECGMRITDVIWTGDMFAMIGNGIVYTSTDGQAWAEAGATSFSRLASSGARYAAINLAGAVAWTDDLSGWTVVVDSWDSLIRLNEVVWTGGRFAAVGGTMPDGAESKAVVALSGNAEDWTFHALDETDGLWDIVWAFNQFVAVGDSGSVVTSKDGYTWYKQNSGVSETLLGVCYTGSNCVAVGMNGTVLTSPHGVNWTKRDSKTTQHLTDVAYENGVLVAVGVSVIISSQ